MKTKPMNPGGDILIPLNKLKPSPRNVRREPHGDAHIAALAASIKANGLLQNLVVQPEQKDGKATGHYLVDVGEGRRLALTLLAKQKELRKDEPVRCMLGRQEDAEQVSLAENIIREAMHPADEFEAFALLHNDKGMAAEDIAVRFGVSATVVRQRLKLGAVGPVLMQVFRDGDMTLEQLMAFTVTDDHARQEEVWSGAGWNNSAHAIKRALTEGQVPRYDRRAQFIGAEAYVVAGGVITRDLFDEEDGGYFADAALVDRLVAEGLAREAQAVRAEGWAWVMVATEFDHCVSADMRRIYAKPIPPRVEDEAEIEALQTQYDELAAEIESGGGDDAEDKLGVIEARLEELQDRKVFEPGDIARAGAFVSLGHDGRVYVQRGFIRKGDETKTDRVGDGEDKLQRCGVPDKLMLEMTAYRTLALRETLAARSDVALLVVVHALVLAAFYPGGRASCLDITLRGETLSRHAPDIEGSAFAQARETRHAKLGALLPDAADDLWDTLCGLSDAERLTLLAHCAAASVDFVSFPGGGLSQALKHAQKVAQAVSLDMREHWAVSAKNYLGRVSKPMIVAAVSEAVTQQAAENIATMKKAAMADAAERLMAGKGWLPQVLR